MSEPLRCPRRDDFPGGGVFKFPDGDHWREDGSCSYCGSISGGAFLALLADGGGVIPTDKNYKAYIGPARTDEETAEARERYRRYDIPQIMRAEGHDADAEKWVEDQLSYGTVRQEAKFYFQHLSAAERARFIDMLNEGKVKFAYPGYFYRLPFFIKREAA